MGADGGKPVVLAGVSRGPVCGVRDHTYVLADALRSLGRECVIVWDELPATLSPLEVSRGLRRWAGNVGRPAQDASALILQYSVFSYGHRGVPVGIWRWTGAIRRLPCPRLAYVHEHAYPWADGPRGWTWAFSQRVALRAVIGAVDAVAMTTEPRVRWLESRRWLPSRPAVFAPVCSTLPAPAPSPDPSPGPPPERPVIGVFGYGPSSRPAPVLRALGRLRALGLGADLLLLGAPGPSSAAAARWYVVAEENGLVDALHFTGVLPAADLAAALSRCSVLVFTDASGANGRRTSVAAALALGVPVVAFDGPESWPLLSESEAIVTVPAEPERLALAIRALVVDPGRRRDRAERGRAFYASQLEPQIVARRLLEALCGRGAPLLRNR